MWMVNPERVIEPPSHKLQIWFIIKYMPIIKLNFLDLKTVDKYKKAFVAISRKKLSINNIELKIFPEDFEHACYEYLEGGIYKGRFSKKRARRLSIIEQIAKNEIPTQMVWQSNRKKPTLAIISEVAECCVIFLPVVKNNNKYFRFVTIIVFGRGVESGSKKIFESGKTIDRKNISKLFTKEKES